MTMNPTHMERLAFPPPHESRKVYMKEKQTRKRDDPKMCEVLADQLNGRQPWLTLVLGSGCSQDELLLIDSLVGVAKRLELAAGAEPALEDTTRVADVISDFAYDLIQDRLRIQDLSHRIDAVSPPPTPSPTWLLELTFVAALLSRLYFEAKAGSFNAPRRSPHQDEVHLRRTSHSNWDTLNDTYGDRCRRAVGTLLDRLARLDDVELPSPARKTLVSLLARVSAGLTRDLAFQHMTISAADVHGLAEIVWSCLVDFSNALAYPGWTDLLVDLSNYDEPEVGRVGLPSFSDFMFGRQRIGARYSAITRHSWQDGRSVPAIYDAAAALLTQQHIHVSNTKRTQSSPVVAFSTSFDLELEQALLRAGKPFSVVMPVHVVASSGPAAVFTIWCRLQVSPLGDSSDIEKILSPHQDQWHLLAAGEDWLWDGPIVVRLAGCPSIRLPDLRSNSRMRAKVISSLDHFDELVEKRFEIGNWDTKEEVREVTEGNLEMIHALIMNEYDAVLHSSADQARRPADHTSKTPQTDSHRLLSDLALDRGEWSRFWLLLGVQIQDSAVRHRVTSLISTLPARGKDAKAHGFPPRRFGLAVNLHSTELEQELMSWSGFDMVRANISDFVLDLAHYRDHLVAGAKFQERCSV